MRATVPSRVVVQSRSEPTYGFRRTAGSATVDMVLKLVFYAYAALVVVGMALGGGAPYIILELLKPDIASDSTLGVHVLAAVGLGMLALPLLGYVLPALVRVWRGLRRIEAEAGGRPAYIWPER